MGLSVIKTNSGMTRKRNKKTDRLKEYFTKSQKEMEKQILLDYKSYAEGAEKSMGAKQTTSHKGEGVEVKMSVYSENCLTEI